MADIRKTGQNLLMGTSLIGAYGNVPKRKNINPYLAKSNNIGATQYYAEDPSGIIDQIVSTPRYQYLSAKDLYNPTFGERASSISGAAADAYGAMSNMIDGTLQGRMGYKVIKTKAQQKLDNQDTANKLKVTMDAKAKELLKPAPTMDDLLLAADQKGWVPQLDHNPNPLIAGQTHAPSLGIERPEFDEVSYKDWLPEENKYASFPTSDELSVMRFNNNPMKTSDNNSYPYYMLQGRENVTELPLNKYSMDFPKEGLFPQYGYTYQQNPYLAPTFACGGHKFDRGGVFDIGAMTEKSADMAAALIGGITNTAGMFAERNAARNDARLNNALNSFNMARNAHNQSVAIDDTMDNMFNLQAVQAMAEGGPLNTQGAEYPMEGNYNYIGNGGTHEQNPMGGVLQGISADGQPNLVEQDEVVWNNYVFSNRLTVPEKFRKEYKLGNNKDMSFSKAAEKLSAEAKERPNDPISNNGMEAVLGALRDCQEELKMKQQAAKIKRMIGKMSPEELMGLQQSLMQGMQQPMPQQQAAPEEMMPQPTEGEPMMAACGGHLYKTGGGKSHRRTVSTIGTVGNDNTMDFLNDILSTIGKQYVKKTASSYSTPAPQIDTDKVRFERLLDLMNDDQLNYLASQYSGYRASDYENTNGKELLKQFLVNNAGNSNRYDNTLAAIKKGQTFGYIDPETIKYAESVIKNGDSTDWSGLFNVMNAYDESLKKSVQDYKYHADRRFKYEDKDVANLEKDPDYQAFTNYTLKELKNLSEGKEVDSNVLEWAKILDQRINQEKGDKNPKRIFSYNDDGTIKTNKDGKPIFNSEMSFDELSNMVKGRREDGIGGIYHFYTTLKDPTTNKTGVRTIYRMNGQAIDIDDPSKYPFIKEIGRSTEIADNGYVTNYVDLDPTSFDVTAPTVPGTEGETEQVDLLNTLPRYAPVLGSGIAALQSLFEEPKDYSVHYAPRKAAFEPIGDYLPFNPVDTQRYINVTNGRYAAQDNAIYNAAAGNRNMAAAQIALSNMQRQEELANIFNNAEVMNTNRLQQRGEFNRGTNLPNAQAFDQTSQFNAGQFNGIIPSIEQYNSNMAHTVQNELDAARSANLTNFYDNIGAIGQENVAFNMANTNPAFEYLIGTNPWQMGEVTHKGKNGGLLTKKNRRK